MLNLLEKNSLKKFKYSRSSPDHELVFADLRTLPDNSGKPKSAYSK